MPTQTGSIDFTSAGGLKSYAAGQFATQGTVSDMQTAISQNAQDIALRATKTEASQMAQPNLTPYFSMPMTQQSDLYWANLTYARFTQHEDGWAHFEYTNTGSSTVNSYIGPKAISTLLPGGNYTLLAEFRNVAISGATNGSFYSQQISNAQIWGTEAYGGFSITNAQLIALENGEGKFYKSLTLLDAESKDPSGTVRGTLPKTIFMTINQQVAGGQSVSYDLRISLYEGEYAGPYKPYSGTQLYASQAELKVQADRIGMVVSNADASSSLQLTPAAITAVTNNLTIKDSSGSATVISGGKIQANSLTIGDMSADTQANILNSNVVVGGRNLLLWTGESDTYSDHSAVGRRWAFSEIYGTNVVSGNTVTFTKNANGLTNNTSGIRVSAMLSDGRRATETNLASLSFGLDLKAGDALTFSCDVKTSGNRVALHAQYFNGTNRWTNAGSITEYGEPSDTDWHRYSHTFTVTSDYVSLTALGIYCELKDGVTISARNFKLERGNKATDWTSAQEDQVAYSYQSSQPNLAPFFSMGVSDSTYWYTTTNLIANASNMGDGWASFAENSLNINVSPLAAKMSHLKSGTGYTALLEVVNSNVDGTVTFNAYTATNSMIAASKSATITGDGEYRILVTTKDDLSDDAITHFRLFLNASASGASFAGDVRLSLYEGEYSGPYKPYSGSQLYATSAELEETNSTLSGAVTDIAELDGRLHDEVSGRENWLRFNSDGLVIGDRNSAFYTSVTESSMEFHNGDTVLATASGSIFDAPSMKSGELHFGDTLRDFWMWTIRNNGNLSLKWIGPTE